MEDEYRYQADVFVVGGGGCVPPPPRASYVPGKINYIFVAALSLGLLGTTAVLERTPCDRWRGYPLPGWGNITMPEGDRVREYRRIPSQYRGSFNVCIGFWMRPPAPAGGPRLVCPPAQSGRLTSVSYTLRGVRTCE